MKGCTSPTFQLGTAMNTIIWGQDRINVVQVTESSCFTVCPVLIRKRSQDRLLGWWPETSTLKASVAGFPRLGLSLLSKKLTMELTCPVCLRLPSLIPYTLTDSRFLFVIIQ